MHHSESENLKSAITWEVKGWNFGCPSGVFSVSFKYGNLPLFSEEEPPFHPVC